MSHLRKSWSGHLIKSPSGHMVNDQLTWNRSSGSSFSSNTNMCKGDAGCDSGNDNGFVVRLDTVTPPDTGSATLTLGGFANSTTYDVCIIGQADGGEYNELTCTCGTATLTVPKRNTSGDPAFTRYTATGAVTSNGSGVVTITASATIDASGTGGAGAHAVILCIDFCEQ